MTSGSSGSMSLTCGPDQRSIRVRPKLGRLGLDTGWPQPGHVLRGEANHVASWASSGLRCTELAHGAPSGRVQWTTDSLHRGPGSLSSPVSQVHGGASPLGGCFSWFRFVGPVHGGRVCAGPWTAHWVHGGLCPPPPFSTPGSWWTGSGRGRHSSAP